MNRPIVSIIVPVYNVELYIRTCLDSIWAQTFTDWEAILVDDGSTDQSGDICDEYATKDSRFVVVHKRNGGVSSARNRGLDEAQGDWITFIDADDEIVDDALNTMYEAVSASIDIVIAGYKKVNELKEVTYEIIERIGYIRNQNEAILEVYTPPFYSYMGYICAKMYRRELIKSYKISFDESIYVSEDRLFLLTYLSVIKGDAYFTTVPVYYYYERNDSVMGMIRKDFNAKVYTEIIAMGKAFRLFKSNGSPLTIVERSKREIVVSGYTILHILKQTKKANLRNIFYTIKLMAQEAGWFYVIGYLMKSFVKHKWEKLCKKKK